MTKYKLEVDLFKPVKTFFKEQGYAVYAEVPNHYRCVDVVAVKPKDHCAVEMKMSFSNEVVRQAGGNAYSFHKSYIAIPTKPRGWKNYWEGGDPEIGRGEYQKIARCVADGVGILYVAPDGEIDVLLVAQQKNPYREFDFAGFEENKSDRAGLPFQKGVSPVFLVLDRVKRYVTKNPNSNWQEVYENIQHHYSSKVSLSGSMSQWKGFSLDEFKKTLKGLNNI